MEKQKYQNGEMKGDEVDLVTDEKLFLQKLLRILERPAPKLQQQEQTKENYKNVDRMETGCTECSRKEPHEEENNEDVPNSGWSQAKNLKTQNETREARREESDADRSNIQVMRDRKEVLQKEMKEEIKLRKQIEQELENQAKLHQTLREKLRNEKMQRQTRERKLLNGIKEREYLQKKLKHEEKACEYFETKITKESNHRQRLQDDLKTEISRTKIAQQKLIDEIKLTEYLQTESEKGNVHYMAKEEVKTMLNRRVKELEAEAIPEAEIEEQPEKHEGRRKDSPKDVSSN
jgi:hypothetical protein